MSSALAGSLHTSSFADVLSWLVRETRTGVLRIRHSGPDGAARGEIVLADGKLIGGGIFRAGGYKGTGDALVDAALCSPEDAQGALDYAAQTAQYSPGTLREGAERAGVPIDRVEAALVAHLEWVLRTMTAWKAGSWELILEGLPADAEDRDSAASRAFLLDQGVDPSALNVPAELSKTLDEQAASVVQDPDRTRKSKAVTTPPPAAVKLAPPEVPVPQMDTEPEFRAPELTAPTSESPSDQPMGETGVERPDAVTGRVRAVEPPVGEGAGIEPPDWDNLHDPADVPTGELPASVTANFTDELATEPPAAIPEGEGEGVWADPVAPAFEVPENLSDERTPAGDHAGPTPVFETPSGDLGEDEPEPPVIAREDRLDVGAPLPSSLGEADLFADADDSDADTPEPAEEPAAVPDHPELEEPTNADIEPAGEVDWAAPGAGETALMEAETLLDSDVLSVMLEMGNSAAATAAAAPSLERVLTGHVVLVDEEGQLTGVVLAVPLREAGYVVHVVRGLTAATEMFDRVAADAQKPLAIVDLLLKRGDDGMLGGLDLVSRAASLEIPAILLGEAGDDVRAKAEEAGVSAIIHRPLRSELKDEKLRKPFVEAVLAAVDAHRPHPEWVTPEEIPEALDTGGPSVEEGGWDLQEIEKKAEEVEDLPDFGMTDPAARMDALWRETISGLSGPTSRPEILLHVLRFGAEMLTRAVLFTPNAKGKELTGFGQFGIELAPGVDADDAVRKIRFPLEGHPGVDQAVRARQPMRAKPGTSEWEGHLTICLGGITPEEVFLGPVFCQGRLAALLYGDMLPSKTSLPDVTNLEVILGQAGMALDRAELEARIAELERKD